LTIDELTQKKEPCPNCGNSLTSHLVEAMVLTCQKCFFSKILDSETSTFDKQLIELCHDLQTRNLWLEKDIKQVNDDLTKIRDDLQMFLDVFKSHIHNELGEVREE